MRRLGSRILGSLAAAVGCLAVLVVAGPAAADEGMWTFDNFPAAAVKAKYGVDIDAAWLDRARAATARLSVGCSTSIVSDQGLMLTNNHCVDDCAYDLSDPAHDLVATGFVAVGRSEERRCPDMEADVLLAIHDVTADVQAALAGRQGQDFIAARNAVFARIEGAACAGKEQVRACEIVTLYKGGVYQLYVYDKYDDVRLVFAPEAKIAFFGGDPDNFNFPRYDLDCAFLRLYRDGRPIASPAHLKWNPSPPTSGEAVFTIGNPGGTDRLLTADELQSLKDVSLPDQLDWLGELRGRLIEFSEQGPVQARLANEDLQGVENDFKATRGEFEALADPTFLGAKRASDAALKARIEADPALAARTGDVFADIASLQGERARLWPAYFLLEADPAPDSQLYDWARTLVRAAQERGKPDAVRLPDYLDARLPQVARSVLDPKRADPTLERLDLEFWLLKVRETLGVDSPQSRALIGDSSPEALAVSLSRSRLADPAVRQALWTGGLPAVQASDDPLIRFVLATDPVARAARQAWLAKIDAPGAAAHRRLADAEFRLRGAGDYPDATFTPRISYGAVRGWQWRGETVGPFTTFAGLWARATGTPPFDLDPRWLAARPKLASDTIFDFTTDNDIVGGNSGSPLLDAKGEIIGVAFDGNIQSLGGQFGFDEGVNRSVILSGAAITEALEVVYDDKPLVAELMARHDGGGAK